MSQKPFTFWTQSKIDDLKEQIYSKSEIMLTYNISFLFLHGGKNHVKYPKP